MLVISGSEMERIFSMDEAVEAVEEAMKIYSSGKCFSPLRTRIDVPEHGSTVLFMPVHSEALKKFGIKIVSVYPGNPKKGLEPVPAVVLLFDDSTGYPLAMMDGTLLTKIRTGAVQGLATRVLSREDSKVAMVIGCGSQAPYQIEALMRVRKIEKLYLHDVVRERAMKLAEKVTLRHPGLEVKVVEDPDEAVPECDIITSVTTSTTPTFDGRLLKDGTHVNGMGSYRKDMREIDGIVVERAGKIFVDTKEGCIEESGDVASAIEERKLREDDVVEIGEVLLGLSEGRKSENEITVFKSVGIAIADLVVAARIYEKALTASVGTEVRL